MSESPEERYLTYDEAARETGHSAEAIRKMLVRGRLRRGRETNSGRPTIALTQAELDDLRAGQPVRTEGRPDKNPVRTNVRPDAVSGPDNSTIKALSDQLQAIMEQGQAAEAAAAAKLVATLEKGIERAEKDAAAAKAALEAERSARDAERSTWTASIDALTAELAANRAGRLSDRRIATAAVRRIRQQGLDTAAQLAAVQEQLDRMLAGQGASPETAVAGTARLPSLKGLLARILTRGKTVS